MTFIGIFLEGLLSFLSPCVLPLVPLYMSYLSTGAKTIDSDGKVKYKTLKVFVATLFFVLGISVTFVILALTTGVLYPLIAKYSNIISIIAGVVLIFFGLHTTGLINISFLNKEKKIEIKVDHKNISYLKAFLLGFAFSFAWTPCIGPLLANAIALAGTSPKGFLYILVYGLGLVLPFIVTGLCTSFILNLINKYKKVLKYTSIIAGVIIICFGIYMIYDASNKILYNSGEIETQNESGLVFKDQDGNDVFVDDWKGKYTILNFTATWCGYCKDEIPHFEEFAKTHEDINCFYVMSDLVNNQEGLIKPYHDENHLSIPILVDENSTLNNSFAISGYPTTYVICPDLSALYCYAGVIDNFEEIINYAREVYEGQQR